MWSQVGTSFWCCVACVLIKASSHHPGHSQARSALTVLHTSDPIGNSFCANLNTSMVSSLVKLPMSVLVPVVLVAGPIMTVAFVAEQKMSIQRTRPNRGRPTTGWTRHQQDDLLQQACQSMWNWIDGWGSLLIVSHGCGDCQWCCQHLSKLDTFCFFVMSESVASHQDTKSDS